MADEGKSLEIRSIDDYNHRINHPDFYDVYRTTYKKGTIKSIKQLWDEPIVLDDWATVKMDEGGEVELPLFYHPKLKMWDRVEIHNPPGYIPEYSFPAMEAGKLSADGKSIQMAHLSFRCDDEVVVQCFDGEPVRVIGFVDGMPRFPEDLIQIVNHNTCDSDCPANVVFSNSKQDLYYEEKTPDGREPKFDVPFELFNKDFAAKPYADLWGWEDDYYLVEYIGVVGPLIWAFQFLILWNYSDSYHCENVTALAAQYTDDLWESVKNAPKGNARDAATAHFAHLNGFGEQYWSFCQKSIEHHPGTTVPSEIAVGTQFPDMHMQLDAGWALFYTEQLPTGGSQKWCPSMDVEVFRQRTWRDEKEKYK